MSQRQSNLLCLKDTLEHLALNHERLEWTEDADHVRVLTEVMIRDLERCLQLCQSLHRRSLQLVAM
jgi:hypothetical protein